MNLEELKAKLQSLKDALNGEEDETKKGSIKTEIGEIEGEIQKLENAGGGDDGDKDVKIPLYKYNKLKDKYDALDAKVEELQRLDKQKRDADLADQNKFKELAENKQQEVSTLQEQINGMVSKMKKERISILVREAVNAAGPKDVIDVLPHITEADYTVNIDDEGNIISISGLGEVLEKLKQDKDYLFGGVPHKNDNREPGENNRHNPGGSGDNPDIETQFRNLLEKSQKEGLSPTEQVQFNDLARKVKEARKEKENNEE